MIVYLALRAGLLLARLLPDRVLVALCVALFSLSARLSPRRALVSANLAALAREGAPARRPEAVFSSYGRYWAELLIEAVRPGLLDRRPLRVEGEEHLRAAAARGPICLLSGHLGNWDLLGHWVARRLPGFTVAAEALEPPALFQLFKRLRLQGGSDVLVADGGGLRFFRLLKAGRSIGLIADRVFGAGSERGQGQRSVPFLGGWRRFPSAGMDLARRAGATLLPIFMLREAGGYVIKVHPPLPETGDPVVVFARTLEEEILAHPEQWCVLYSLHDADEAESHPEEGHVKGAASL